MNKMNNEDRKYLVLIVLILLVTFGILLYLNIINFNLFNYCISPNSNCLKTVGDLFR